MGARLVLDPSTPIRREEGGGEVGLDGKRGAQTRYTRLTRGDEIKGVERESGWERRGKCKWN